MATVSPGIPLQASSGATGISDTASHQIFPAAKFVANSQSLPTVLPGAATKTMRNYLTDLTLSNTTATATVVNILDGAVVIYSVNVPASAAPFAVDLTSALIGSSNTAMNIQNVTNASGVVWDAQGYAAY